MISLVFFSAPEIREALFSRLQTRLETTSKDRYKNQDFRLFIVDATLEDNSQLLELMCRDAHGIKPGDSGWIVFLGDFTAQGKNAFELANPRYERNEFHIRVLGAYELASSKPPKIAVDLTSAETIEKIADAVVEQCLHSEADHTGWGDRLHSLRQHIATFHRMTPLLPDPARAPTTQAGEASYRRYDNIEFLTQLGALHRLGRSKDNKAEKLIYNDVPWLYNFGGSYYLNDRIDGLAQGTIAPREDDPGVDGLDLKDCLVILHSYYLHRDLARCLVKGASRWVSQRQQAKFKILVIDELFSDKERTFFTRNLDEKERTAEIQRRQDLKMKFQEVNQILGPEATIDLELTGDWDAIRKDMKAPRRVCRLEDFDPDLKPREDRLPQPGDTAEVAPANYDLIRFQPQEQPRAVQSASTTLVSYDLILSEMEFQREVLGHKLVREITRYFEQHNEKGRPRIMVLTRSEHIAHIHQCLSRGAEAYILKNRLHQLPARIAELAPAPLPKAPDSRKSNFLALYDLMPERIAYLQSEEQHNLLDRSEEKEAWIRNLPKADLHFHIGTSISLTTIRALAYNTLGHLCDPLLWHKFGDLTSGTAKDIEASSIDNNLKEVHLRVFQVCSIVILAGIKRRDDPHLGPLASIIQGAQEVFQKEDADILRNKDFGLTEENIFEKIIEILSPPHRTIKPHHICAMLVCAIDIAHPKWNRYSDKAINNFALKRSPTEPSEIMAQVRELNRKVIVEAQTPYIQTLKEQWIYLDKVKKLADSNLKDQRWERTWLCNVYNAITPVTGTQRIASRRSTTSGTAPDDSLSISEVNDRLDIAFFTIMTGFRRVYNALPKYYNIKQAFAAADSQPSLEDLVEIPDPSSQQNTAFPLKIHQKSLLRYLAGAGLLGAEHLQYPENILLAGWDIVQQSIEDNIIYSEVRCETTGYCNEGMTDVVATDLLLRAFDLAQAYHVVTRSEDKQGAAWVRINILLGAKRHKKPEKCQEIVSLLDSYLRQTNTISLLPKEAESPRWWQPSQVVGFDLSGDENHKETTAEEFKQMLLPLHKDSAPITIHAGEAASAQSIWNAVYQLGARRIGHGLRLRENRTLLDHCINAGLCMEMCPISNAYTNIFTAVDRHNEKDPVGEARQFYPLRYFMDRGLDVCINTDNRSLHSRHTLTDEYIKAAEMVGGLTRWETLKIIKSGFKNAFLPKEDIVELLRYVEDEIFDAIAESEWRIQRKRLG